MSLGENIYRLRTEKNMSQGDLADALEVSRQSVSKWENDSAVPELDKLIKLGTLFDVTLDELVTGKKPDIPPPQAAPTLSLRSILGIILIGIGLLGIFLSVLFSELIIFALLFLLAGVVLLFPKTRNSVVACCTIWIVFVIIADAMSRINGTLFYIFLFIGLCLGILCGYLYYKYLEEDDGKSQKGDGSDAAR